MANITLTKLTEDDREQFILDNQRAFKFGAMEEFGCRGEHCEEDGEIISRKPCIQNTNSLLFHDFCDKIMMLRQLMEKLATPERGYLYALWFSGRALRR